MSNLDTLAESLKQVTETGHPPVHLWQPERLGDIDITIQHDGSWVHEGGLIQREALVKLFSSVLWFEDGAYFLKTPAEQLKISVETTPFFITQMIVTQAHTAEQRIAFTTTYGDTVILGKGHPLTMNNTLIPDQEVPLVEIRYGMPGRLSRSVFTELVEFGALESTEQGDFLNILSNGVTSSLNIEL